MRQRVYQKTSEHLSQDLAIKSIDLTITHPPFQETDLAYKQLARKVFWEVYKVQKPDTIMAIVNHDRKNLGAIPRHIILFQAAIAAGFSPHDQKIWHRQIGLSLFRKTYGYIQLFAKGNPSRKKSEDKEYYNDVWTLPDSMQRGSFKDAYHEEIPKRIIKVYSSAGDTILDPFLGTGTTLKVAEQLNRNGIGCEIDKTLANHYPPNWEIMSD